MRASITKWITASLINHFKTYVSALTLIEGQIPDSTVKTSNVEIHFEGPIFTKLYSNDWHIYISVDFVVQRYDEDKNYYNMDTLVGTVVDACVPVTVYKYGPETIDDQSIVGCLQLAEVTKSLQSGNIQVLDFGDIAPELRWKQKLVRCAYEMNVTL